MYIDNANRPHNYNEESFYPEHAKNYMRYLESIGFIKTNDDKESNEVILNYTGIPDGYRKMDYYRISIKDNITYIESYELQYMKTYKDEDCEEYIILKSHKYKNLYHGNRYHYYKGNKIVKTHFLINFTKDGALYLDKEVKVGSEFDLCNVIESLRKWGEHKLGYLAIPKKLY